MTAKSNQSLTKRGFNIPHVFDRIVVILLVGFGLVLVYELLAKAATDSFSTYYSALYYYGEEYNNLSLITFIAGVLVSLVQFRFLQVKTKCITILSFGESRRGLFRKKFWFPLAAMILMVVGLYIVLLRTDLMLKNDVFSLADEHFANFLIALLPLVVGYTVGAFASIVSGKTSETIAFGTAVCAFPVSLFNLVDAIFTLSLRGYYSFASDYWFFSNYNGDVACTVTKILSLFDPLYTLNYNVSGFENKNVSGQFWFNTPAFYIIKNLVWLGIFVGLIFLVEKYFVKSFEAENCDRLGKNNFVRITCAVTSALFVASWFFGEISRYWYDEVSPSNMLGILVIGLLLSLVVTLIFTALLYRNKKQIRFSLQGIGITVLLGFVVYFISITGCFGYSTYTPDTDEIKTVMINDVSCLLPTGTEEYFSSMYETLSTDMSFKTIDDIELVKDIHKFIARDKKSDTNEPFTIVYELENGQSVYRAYSYLSSEACEKMSALWETDSIREFYKTILNQNPDINSNNLDNKWFAWEKEFIFNNNFKNISYTHYDDEDYEYYSDGFTYRTIADADSLVIFSKDSVSTIITNEDISRGTMELLKTAMYKDYSSMSAQQYYKPKDQIGVISLASCSALLDFEKKYLEEGEEELTSDSVLRDNECNLYKFPVTSDMVNTIAVLKNAGLYKYLNCDKKIEKAHLIESKKVIQWMNSPLEAESMITTVGDSFRSAITYSWNDYDNAMYLVCGCGYTEFSSIVPDWYSGPFYEDECSPIPESEVEIISPEKAEKLREKAFMTYNAGNKCKFLVIKYTDGTANMLVIPQE